MIAGALWLLLGHILFLYVYLFRLLSFFKVPVLRFLEYTRNNIVEHAFIYFVQYFL
jgi:hypothetical protein